MRANRSLSGTDSAYQLTPANATDATTDSTSVFNGKSTPFSMPNAAPVLCTRVRSRKPGMTEMLSWSGSRSRTIGLGDLIEDDDRDRNEELEPPVRESSHD